MNGALESLRKTLERWVWKLQAVGEVRTGREQKAAPSMQGEKSEHRFGVSTQHGQLRAPGGSRLAGARTPFWTRIMAG